MKHLFSLVKAFALLAVVILVLPCVANAVELDDKELAQEVEKQLMKNKEYDATSIIVTSKDGVVRLRGSVRDEEAVSQMKNTAKGVPGVKEVKTHIDILMQNDDGPSGASGGGKR